MNTITQFTVGQDIEGYETLKALPVGTRLVRPAPGAEQYHWITNGPEATRYGDSLDPTTQPWHGSVEAWTPHGWRIADLPLYVGQKVKSREDYDALPVGTRMKYAAPHALLVRIKKDDGRWTTASDAEGHGTPSGGLDMTYGYVIEQLGEAEDMSMSDGVEAEPTPEPEEPRLKVGDHVKTVEEYEALPVGTEMALAGYPMIVRTREANGQWRDENDDTCGTSQLSTQTGYIINRLPLGGERPAVEPEPVDEGPLSPETVRQFKARFRSLALSASCASDIDLEPVYRYLSMGGFLPEESTIGLPVYGYDHDAFEALPPGTVLKQADADDPDRAGVWITDGSTEPEWLAGSDDRDKFTLFKVHYLPDHPRLADRWVHEHMTTEQARAAHREIEELKLLIWDLGNKGRDESERAGDRWCSVFEDTLAEVGIDESFARGKGWVAPVRTEEISVHIRIDGVTVDGQDSDSARDTVGGENVTIDGFTPARVEWTYDHYIHNVQVEHEHCACDGYDDDYVRAILQGAGINFTEFDFTPYCDND